MIYKKLVFSQSFSGQGKLQQAIQSTALACSLLGIAVLAGANPAWADLPLLQGQAITTHFSGTNNNTWSPLLGGKVLTVLDIRDPAANGAPFALPGPTNWTVPRYQHASWDAATLGEVFGLALDTSKTQPDIYVISSSSTYFGNTAFNMTPGSLANGYGGVFKIDGISGAASLLVNLPNTTFSTYGYTRYAGLAQIAANPNARTLYVANYEDGKIYILNMDTGATLETFDHGTQAASPTITDDDTAGFTQLGRRISAVQYNPVEQRLYYSVWASDGNKIWSVPVASNGTTNGAARFELSYASPNWSWSNHAVITDIAFSKDGQRMLAAEMPISGGSYARSSHYTTGIEWVGSGGSWALNNSLESGNGTIAVGLYGGKINAAGSVSYGHNNYGTNAGASEPCEDAFVLMGDALHFPSPYIYGIQISPLTGSTTATLGQDDYVVDLENNVGPGENMDKSGLGDVEVLSGCSVPPPPTHSIGNRVWFDTNNNGIADSGEQHAGDGIKLELKDSTGNAVLQTTTTDVNGRYLFHGLAAGSYQVCVTADNFAAGNKLDKYKSSTGFSDANTTTVDGDDSGDDDASNGVCSTVVTLDATEPTGEYGITDQQDGADGQGTPDANSNLTVDFGFVPPIDLKLTKTVDKAAANRGSTLTYTLTLRNDGPAKATGVQVTDKLPAGVSWVSDDGAGAYDKDTGTWTVGEIENGADKLLKITVTVN